MNQLTEEILSQITDYGRLLFSVEQVAIIIGIEPKKAKIWAKDVSHPFRQAYLKGRLMTDAEVRKTTITLAKNGSSPAVAEVKKYMTDSNMDNAI